MKGIVFDMDNTLLRSNIDFTAMKTEIFQYLSSQGILPGDIPLERHTTATIIEKALQTNRMTDRQTHVMWEICKRHEQAGMHNAGLEPGVRELLEQLYGKYILAIVTNNSIAAAEKALKENGIADFFDCVVGREQMKALKPSPDGYLYVLNRYEDTEAEEWISVGDSWIDGKASMDAGIPFISYQGDIEKMRNAGVHPLAEMKRILDLIPFLKKAWKE